LNEVIIHIFQFGPEIILDLPNRMMTSFNYSFMQGLFMCVHGDINNIISRLYKTVEMASKRAAATDQEGPKSKRKKQASEEDSGFDLTGATDLEDLRIPVFGLDSVDDLPVIFIHAPPRQGGMTTLIASLIIQAQDDLGVNAAIVLCDRPGENYMNHILPLGPQGTVINQPPDRVLEELIRVQSDSSTLELGSAKRRIVLALDDVVYTSKLLSSEAFIRNIKRAKQFDIMIIIGTTTPTILPRIAATFVTHAFVTQCYALDDIKLLQKCLFGKFAKAEDLAEVLDLCRPHEFLVNIIKPSASVMDITRRYTATVYRKTALPRASRTRHAAASVCARTSGSGGSESGSGSSDTEEEDDDVTVRHFVIEPKLAGYLSGVLAKLSSR
jgi:hypothetical protein